MKLLEMYIALIVFNVLLFFIWRHAVHKDSEHADI